jgi:hypothetical protein
LKLNEAASLTPQDFETQWKTLPAASEIQTHCSPSKPNLDQIVAVFGGYGIKAVAKGGTPAQMKFFLYAQQVRGRKSKRRRGAKEVEGEALADQVSDR